MDAQDAPTLEDLRTRYAELAGESTTSRNRRFLEKRLAWLEQARTHGGLSERALQRAQELARDSDLRLVGNLPPSKPSKPRGPEPGTVLTRIHRGRRLQVRVLEAGFEFEGEVYRSLTAVAKAITGQHWGGAHFFGLRGKKP